MIVLHYLPKEVVDESIRKSIDRLRSDCHHRVASENDTYIKYYADKLLGKSKNWPKPRDRFLVSYLDEIRDMYSRWILDHTTIYSKVKVVEDTVIGKFVLNYHDEEFKGTGPFDSYEAAVKWFTGGGR